MPLMGRDLDSISFFLFEKLSKILKKATFQLFAIFSSYYFLSCKCIWMCSENMWIHIPEQALSSLYNVWTNLYY